MRHDKNAFSRYKSKNGLYLYLLGLSKPSGLSHVFKMQVECALDGIIHFEFLGWEQVKSLRMGAIPIQG